MIRHIASRAVPLLVVAALWELLPRTGVVNPELLPPLSAVLHAWIGLALSGELAYHAAVSLANLAIGLALGVLFGGALGVLMAWYPTVYATAGALVQMTYPVPRSALIPVMILWFGLGAASKVAAIFSGCLLPVVVSAYNAARGVDQTLVWSAMGLGASRHQVLWEIVVPAAIPDLLGGVRTALATGFVLMVTSELLVGDRGLGYLIGFLGDGGIYPAMFAVVLTVAALGFAADRLYLLIMRRVLQWRE